MVTYQTITTDALTQLIRACAGEKFTGQLNLKIKGSQNLDWIVYFHQGDLIWCTSNLHPIRRWYRLLFRHCPQFVVDSKTQLQFRESAIAQGLKSPHVLDYGFLVELTRHKQIQQEQIQAIVEDSILEILFDILHWGEHLRYRTGEQLTYRQIPRDNLDSTLVRLPVEQAWRQAIKLWEAWERAGLADLSPNQAPVILQAEALQQQTSASVYRNLTSLADSDLTFRDLAVKMNRSLLLLAQSIMPFVQNHLIGLRNIEDYTYQSKPIQAISRFVKTAPMQSTSPLVVCIDDSTIDNQIMNKFITEAGYHCINIQDSLQAIPILMECQPKVIFLDLVMPIANGYEICAQIRRISIFKYTPVIILSSNDKIVDRIRAKIVGCSGFLSKPIDREKVIATLQKHYSITTSVRSQEQSTEWSGFLKDQVLKVE